MKSISTAAAVLAIAIATPLFASTASAAQAPGTTPHKITVQGESLVTTTPSATTGLVARKTDVKTYEVARRWRRRRGRGVGLAAGIIAGAAAAAIISGAARSHHYHRPHYSYRDRYYDRCDRWLYRCDRGYRRACRKFYRHCD